MEEQWNEGGRKVEKRGKGGEEGEKREGQTATPQYLPHYHCCLEENKNSIK